jgi:hypothetical protein
MRCGVPCPICIFIIIIIIITHEILAQPPPNENENGSQLSSSLAPAQGMKENKTAKKILTT